MTTAAAPLQDRVTADVDRVTAIRRDLHANPELMYKEARTSKVVQDELARLGIEFVANLAGGTGVLAHLPAINGGSSKAVALRADMDALPIAEETGLAHASKTPGVMHACGHDGHTAMLLGAAAALAAIEDRPNPVTFLFQPAEEGGAGGERMCDDGCMNGSLLGPPVGRIFGLHGWPGLDLGKVATRPGPLLAATDDFDITIVGAMAHAAMPHMGVDPIVCASQIVTALQTIASRTVDPLDSVVCTVGRFLAGSANNIIPRDARLTGTIRTLRAETRSLVEARFREIVTSIAKANACTAEIHWTNGYPVTDNDTALVEHWSEIATSTMGAQNVEVTPEPFMGGEDFAFYGAHAPACFFLLGLRRDGDDNPAALHTPSFDFNDDAIAAGVEMHCRLALAQYGAPTG